MNLRSGSGREFQIDCLSTLSPTGTSSGQRLKSWGAGWLRQRNYVQIQKLASIVSQVIGWRQTPALGNASVQILRFVFERDELFDHV